MSSRQEANNEILQLLTEAMQKFPHLRFGQLLAALDVVTANRDADGVVVSWGSEFHTESDQTLARVQAALKTLV